MGNTFNFANLLTFIRIVCIPLIAVIFFMSFELSRPIAAVIFILAALTDWLDGWVAREFDQTSKLGAFLDPVADKLIVSVALILIVQSDPTILNQCHCSNHYRQRNHYFCFARMDVRTRSKTSGDRDWLCQAENSISDVWSFFYVIQDSCIWNTHLFDR